MYPSDVFAFASPVNRERKYKCFGTYETHGEASRPIECTHPGSYHTHTHTHSQNSRAASAGPARFHNTRVPDICLLFLKIDGL